MSKLDHWYYPDGKSAHRIQGKNGKERASNIRDARENGLLPSVTTILGVLEKPELSEWKFRQVTGAAYANQPKQGEEAEAYHSRIMDTAFQQVDDAADLGTRIHEAIECAMTDKPWDLSLSVYVEGVKQWVKQNGVTFVAHELRLASTQLGFAGTTDAEVGLTGGRHGILDFKTRKTKPGMECTPFSGQAAQIAAYHMARFGGFGIGDFGVNVFISTTEPGRVEAAWYDQEVLRTEYVFFSHCAAIWRHLKAYDPRQQIAA